MTTISIDKCRDRISALLAKPGMNMVLLAERAGVHRNTIAGHDKPDWNPTVETYNKIATALDRLEKALTP